MYKELSEAEDVKRRVEDQGGVESRAVLLRENAARVQLSLVLEKMVRREQFDLHVREEVEKQMPPDSAKPVYFLGLESAALFSLRHMVQE